MRSRAVAQKRRFRFNEDVDMILLGALMTEGAHMAKWGKMGPLFEKVAGKFYVQMEH